MLHEHDVVRAMVLRAGREVPGTSPLAKAMLGWARTNARWLFGAPVKSLGWTELKRRAAGIAAHGEDARALGIGVELAGALRLGEADTRVLAGAVAIECCPRVRALARLMLEHETDLGTMLAEVAGIAPRSWPAAPTGSEAWPELRISS